MLEMAMMGAKVLQPRSVEMAKKYNIALLATPLTTTSFSGFFTGLS